MTRQKPPGTFTRLQSTGTTRSEVPSWYGIRVVVVPSLPEGVAARLVNARGDMVDLVNVGPR